MSILGRTREKRKTAVGIDVSKCSLERDFLISKAATLSLFFQGMSESLKIEGGGLPSNLVDTI